MTYHKSNRKVNRAASVSAKAAGAPELFASGRDRAFDDTLKKRLRNPFGIVRHKKARRPLNLRKQRPNSLHKPRTDLVILNAYDRRADCMNVKLIDDKGRRLCVGDGHIVICSLYDIVR